MKLLLSSLLVVACAACAAPAQEQVTSSNPAISLELLFERDGFRVYRFTDAGHLIYYVVPAGSVSWSRVESCGKNCTEHVPNLVATTERER